MVKAMSNPLVSICIPTFNGGLHIRETLESVFRQSYKNIEIIIHDDCSTDDTCTIANQFKGIKLYQSSKRVGGCENWKQAVNNAKGEFIKILCQDDILSEFCLEKQVLGLLDKANLTMVSSKRNVLYKNFLFSPPYFKKYPKNYDDALSSFFLFGNTIGEPHAVLFRAAPLKKAVSTLDCPFYLIDYAIYLSVLKFGQHSRIEEVLSTFNIHQHSYTSKHFYKQSTESYFFLKKFNFPIWKLIVGSWLAIIKQATRKLTLLYFDLKDDFRSVNEKNT